MRLLNFLAQAFINTFGITQPSTPKQQRLAAIVLGGLILVTAMTAVSVLGFLLYQLHLGR